MLVLGRKDGEGVVLHWNGETVRVILKQDRSGHTMLAIDAPRKIRILRDDLPDASRLARLEPAYSD